jgi:hypothetical protein
MGLRPINKEGASIGGRDERQDRSSDEDACGARTHSDQLLAHGARLVPPPRQQRTGKPQEMEDLADGVYSFEELSELFSKRRLEEQGLL